MLGRDLKVVMQQSFLPPQRRGGLDTNEADQRRILLHFSGLRACGDACDRERTISVPEDRESIDCS